MSQNIKSDRAKTENSIIFIDGVEVLRDDLKKYSPSEISSIHEVENNNQGNDTEQDEIFGSVIYIETKSYARSKYWRFFSSKSREFSEAVPNYELDSIVQYILNDKVLNEDFESKLSSVDDSSFISIEIIDEKQLEKKYNVLNKKIGVIIKSKNENNID